eukprot:NP_508264.1 Uncharacterized protein CELE_ZK402.1 [Caenorhabditis elegans]
MKRTSAYHRKAGRHVHMVMNASQTTNQAESDEDGVDSATSLPRSPKRARTEMSSSDDDDDLEIIETVDGYPKPEPVDFDFEELLNRDSTYNLLIDHSQEYKEVMMEENNQPTIYGNIPRKVDKGPSIPRRKPKNSVFKNDKKVPMRDFTTDEEEKTPRFPSQYFPIFPSTISYHFFCILTFHIIKFILITSVSFLLKSLQLDSDDDEVQYIGAMKGQPKPEPIFEGFAPHNSNSDHVQEEQKTGVPRFDRQQISIRKQICDK